MRPMCRCGVVAGPTRLTSGLLDDEVFTSTTEETAGRWPGKVGQRDPHRRGGSITRGGGSPDVDKRSRGCGWCSSLAREGERKGRKGVSGALFKPSGHRGGFKQQGEPCDRGGREGGGVAPTGGRGWAACLGVKQGWARTPTCGPRQQYRVAALNLIRNQFKRIQIASNFD
jgi:hypothetical protein